MSEVHDAQNTDGLDPDCLFDALSRQSRVGFWRSDWRTTLGMQWTLFEVFCRLMRHAGHFNKNPMHQDAISGWHVDDEREPW